jgi:hypothetical protein
MATRATLAAAILVAGCSWAEAQDVGPATSPPASQTCWRPRPAPECTSWIVSEIAFHSTFGLTTHYERFNADYPTQSTLTLGYMRNRGVTSALGWTGTIARDNGTGFTTTRAESRYRRWHSEMVGWDFSAGLARKTIRDRYPITRQAYGVTAAAGISTSFVGADIRAEVLKGHGRTTAGVFVGSRFGAQAAPAAAATGMVAYLVYRALTKSTHVLLDGW